MNAEANTRIREQGLEEQDFFRPMRERLRSAAQRMRKAEEGIQLRAEQEGPVEDAIRYVEDVSQRGSHDAPPFARIILPPRTGKTVIAAKLIELSGLMTVFVTSRRLLAEQAYAEFRKSLPQIPIGILTGEWKAIPEKRGVVITTYEMLRSLQGKGDFPSVIADAALLIADEAHHAMTEIRTGILRSAVDSLAIRLALTATPDYDEERVLAKYFPDLIHEITIQEGVSMGLLAKARAFVAAVDVGRSKVRVVNGDYEKEELGLVMTRTPLLTAVEMVRYDQKYRNIPALITCTCLAQARCVLEYLTKHRPKGSPRPAVIVGKTDRNTRRDVLEQFDQGNLDTLISVGVLIEGWNSPRCKLLVDLAPSLSEVRSAQKYARVMTRDGDTEARIVVLLPEGLPRPPILPMDVFGPGLEEPLDEPPFINDSSPVEHPKRAQVWQRLRDAGIRVRSVSTRIRILDEYRVDRLEINRTKYEVVQNLVRSAGLCPLSLSIPGFGRFLSTRFTVDDVGVRGSQLLRELGYPATLRGYQDFVARYFPDEFSDKILLGGSAYFYWKRFREPSDSTAVGRGFRWPSDILSVSDMEESSLDRFQREFHCLGVEERGDRRDGLSVEYGLLAGCTEQPPDAEELLMRKEEIEMVRHALSKLTPSELDFLKKRFEEEATYRSLGEESQRCVETMRQRGRRIERRLEAWIRSMRKDRDSQAEEKRLGVASERMKEGVRYALKQTAKPPLLYQPLVWLETCVSVLGPQMPEFLVDAAELVCPVIEGSTYRARAFTSWSESYGWVEFRRKAVKKRSLNYRQITDLTDRGRWIEFCGVRGDASGLYKLYLVRLFLA